MTTGHIVKSYDEELSYLNGALVRMGELSGAQLAAAVQAVVRRDGEFAREVVAQDAQVNEIEQEIGAQAAKVVALRQPVARDLRDVLSALRISNDLERISDYAANIAKRAIALSQMAPSEQTSFVPRLGNLARQLVRDAVEAFARRDANRAVSVWVRDKDLDQIHTEFFRELLAKMADGGLDISSGTHLLFISKDIERIGDHATNIAEAVYFMVTGETLGERRPKNDLTSFTVIERGT